MNLLELQTHLDNEYNNVLTILGEVGATGSQPNRLYKYHHKPARIHTLKTIGKENALRTTLEQIRKTDTTTKLSTFISNKIKNITESINIETSMEEDMFNIYFFENIDDVNIKLKIMKYGQIETYKEIQELLQKKKNNN